MNEARDYLRKAGLTEGQIGNSVPVRTAKAMALADLQETKWSRR